MEHKTEIGFLSGGEKKKEKKKTELIEILI